MHDFLELLAQERPVGTDNNNKAIAMIESSLIKTGYEIKTLPFDCHVWQWEPSAIQIGNEKIAVEPSPFSESFAGSGRLCAAKTINDLQDVNCQGAILLLSGDITQAPLSPKDYPFYFPDEHKEIIALLEQKQPAAIIAATGKSTLSGQDPFPFFEDGNFLIPSANINRDTYQRLEAKLSAGATTAKLTLKSCKKPSRSRQIIGSKKSRKAKGKIILAAHMDSKYNTPGALDNAVGVTVLLEAAAKLATSVYDIDIVPFNSEEYYGSNGELEYLKMLGDEKIVLMINIDAPCHKNSQTAISFYNLNDAMQTLAKHAMLSNPKVEKGAEWYAGDHAPFVFRGTPCLAVTSSDLFDGALEYTHTPKDSLEIVEFDLVQHSAQYLVDVVAELTAKMP